MRKLSNAAVLILLLMVPLVAGDPCSFSVDKKIIAPGPTVLQIFVTNTSNETVRSVEIIFPVAFGQAYPVGTAGRGQTVPILDNKVRLAAGTPVTVLGNALLPSGSTVIIGQGSRLVRVRENTITLGSTETSLDIPVMITDWLDNLDNLENSCAVPHVFSPDNKLLFKDNLSFTVAGAQALLMDNVRVAVRENGAVLVENVRLYLTSTALVIVNNERATPAAALNVTADTVDLTGGTDKMGRRFVASGRFYQSGLMFLPGDRVYLDSSGASCIKIPPGTEIIFTGHIVLDNSVPLIATGGQWIGGNITISPGGWNVAVRDINGFRSLLYENGSIGQQRTEAFPVFLVAPAAAGTYHLDVRVNGVMYQAAVAINVDNTPPVASISAPKWARGGDIMFFVNFNEQLMGLKNIVVRENNGENLPVSFVPSGGGFVWICYVSLSGDNYLRDGFVTVEVIGATDIAGNSTNIVFDRAFFVDRRRPPAPKMSVLGFKPVDNSGTVSGQIRLLSRNNFENDNIAFIPYPEDDNLCAGFALVVAVGDREYTFTTDKYGVVSYSVTLNEGRQTVRAWFVDKAGNKGDDNVMTVLVDTLPPSIQVSPCPCGMKTNSRTLTFDVVIRDAGAGVANTRVPYQLFRDNENYDKGFACAVENSAGGLMEPNVVSRVVNNALLLTVRFELPRDGRYRFIVAAGDGMSTDYGYGPHSTVFVGEITLDTVPPAAPSFAVPPGGETFRTPLKTRYGRLYLRGTAEAFSTVMVELIDASFSVLARASVFADNIGSWDCYIGLPRGIVVGVRAYAVDAASNAGTPSVLGYFLYDNNPPAVVLIDSPKTEVAGRSVIIRGRIVPDTWEEYGDITVTVSPATASVYYSKENGDFFVSVPLPLEGEYLIAILAADGAGNMFSEQLIIRATGENTITLLAVASVVIFATLAALLVAKRAISTRAPSKPRR